MCTANIWDRIPTSWQFLLLMVARGGCPTSRQFLLLIQLLLLMVVRGRMSYFLTVPATDGGEGRMSHFLLVMMMTLL